MPDDYPRITSRAGSITDSVECENPPPVVVMQGRQGSPRRWHGMFRHTHDHRRSSSARNECRNRAPVTVPVYCIIVSPQIDQEEFRILSKSGRGCGWILPDLFARLFWPVHTSGVASWRAEETGVGAGGPQGERKARRGRYPAVTGSSLSCAPKD